MACVWQRGCGMGRGMGGVFKHARTEEIVEPHDERVERRQHRGVDPRVACPST